LHKEQTKLFWRNRCKYAKYCVFATNTNGCQGGKELERNTSSFPFAELDEFVVMPNHIHGILFFNPPYLRDWTTNKFGPQSKNLASVIRGYKASVKTFSTINQIQFGWQSRFHDHIIHSSKELSNIRQYIINNPVKWADDEDNPALMP